MNWDMGDSRVVTVGNAVSGLVRASVVSDVRSTKYAQPQGSYTVQATSHWVITWSGIGQTGTVTMDPDPECAGDHR